MTDIKETASHELPHVGVDLAVMKQPKSRKI
jgi:hypothetical protein